MRNRLKLYIICALVFMLSLPAFADSAVNRDSDNDGMPDTWEIDNNLNPNLDDSQADPDEDGLVNLDEYQTGTDPRNSDTDGDGLTDKAELTANSNPLSADSLPNPGIYYQYDKLGRIQKVIRIKAQKTK